MEPYMKICPSDNTPKNTGDDCDCFETKLKIPVLSNGYQFPTVADFEDRSKWRAQIASKNLVPLFQAYDLADGSTQDKYFEVGDFRRIIEKGIEKISFDFMTSDKGYSVLKTYENNENFSELFEFNEGEDYSGMYASDGIAVKGRKITSFTVTKMRALKDKVAHVKCEIVYKDKDDALTSVRTKSDLTEDDLDGIHDVTLKVIGNSTSTKIKFEALSGCSKAKRIKSFTDFNIEVKGPAGVSRTITSVVLDDTGFYTITGTGFTALDTLNLSGVTVLVDIIYESTGAVNINF